MFELFGFLPIYRHYKEQQRRFHKWEEYSKKLGQPLKGRKDGTPYIKYCIRGHNAFIMGMVCNGTLLKNLSLLIGLKDFKLKEEFKMSKKLEPFRKEEEFIISGSSFQDIEEEYHIRTSNEDFKRKILTNRVITTVLTLKPEDLFFFDKDDKVTSIPEPVESQSFLNIIIRMPDDHEKLDQLIELGRLIIHNIYE